MKFALVFLLVTVAVASAAQADCPGVCPFLYSPVCGQTAAGVKQTFSNECEMKVKNCQEKTDFSILRESECD